jgi:hypothetical protein
MTYPKHKAVTYPKHKTVGWSAIAIGLATAMTPAWADTTPAGAAATLWLGAMTVIYGSWAVVSRDPASKHSPLLVIALSLAIVPWLGGFAGDAAAWVSWIAGLALLVIVAVYTPTVSHLVSRMSSTRHTRVAAKEHA